MKLINRGAFTVERPYLFFLLLPFLFSCAGTPYVFEPKTTHTIENVPFYPQEMYQCGPASLSEIFNFWGISISPEEITEEVYSKSARGTLTIDMISFAQRKGFKTSQYKGSFEDIKKNIDSGYPLIVLVDYGFSVYQRNHYMTVFGYNENGIIVHSGREPHKFISLREFLKSWQKTKFWTLLITLEQYEQKHQ